MGAASRTRTSRVRRAAADRRHRAAALSPLSEEREARDRERRLERARRVLETRHAAQRRATIEQMLRSARAAGERCSCSITPDMTVQDLAALGAGCTDPLWVCPVLDRIRRRLGR